MEGKTSYHSGALNGVLRDAGQDLFYLRDLGLVTKFHEIRDSNRENVFRDAG